jgi:CDP-6-deoxy-D-xylo-4-hexulose-3-dehydrase
LFDELEANFNGVVNQFSFVDIPQKANPSYMVLPIFLNKKYKNKKKKFIKFIEKKGLETRPVISGSFVNQPSTKLYNLNPKKLKFKGAQEVEDLGFVIGLNTNKTNNKKIDYIVNSLYSIDKI